LELTIIEFTVFWNVTAYAFVERWQHFGETPCLHFKLKELSVVRKPVHYTEKSQLVLMLRARLFSQGLVGQKTCKRKERMDERRKKRKYTLMM
jgi:hypothetical protein